MTGNDIGFLLYYQPVAIVTNNLFVSNQYAFVANHHQGTSIVAHNVFYDNAEIAIVAQASYLSVMNNVIVSNGIAFSEEYVQHGFVGCNVVSGNAELGEGFEGAAAATRRTTPASSRRASSTSNSAPTRRSSARVVSASTTTCRRIRAHSAGRSGAGVRRARRSRLPFLGW